MQEQDTRLDMNKLTPRVGAQSMNLWLAQIALEEALEREQALRQRIAELERPNATEQADIDIQATHDNGADSTAISLPSAF
jgi:hypothetical protein